MAAEIHTAVSLCFSHWEAIPNFDFKLAFERYLSEIAYQGDRYEFDLATMRFVALLKNGHTAFDDKWLWQARGAAVGFSVRSLAEGWTIIDSGRADVPRGEQIAAIDDQPMDQFAASKLPFVGASSERAAAAKLFQRPYLFPGTFTVTLATGACIRIERRNAPSVSISLSPSMQPIDQRQARLLRIPSFGNPAFECEALRLIDGMPSGTGLVVDLRGNGGGDTPLRLLERLMDRPYRTWRATTARHVAFNRATGRFDEPQVVPAKWVKAATDAFRGPLVLAVDRDSASATEDFVMPFKDNGRAIIVGEATAGTSGQPFRKDLGDGMQIWVGARRQFFPEGSSFEGIGIEPNVHVPLRAIDLCVGYDAVIAASIDLLDTWAA